MKLGFGRGLIIVALILSLALAIARYYGVFRRPPGPEEPAVLATQAQDALQAVRERKPGQRRPPTYDQILAPLDRLLTQARTALHNPDTTPASAYQAVRQQVEPVLSIAPLADAQAKTETGYLAKEYRFNDQVGEASQYLATALWEKIQAEAAARRGGQFEDTRNLPAGEMNELRRIIDNGLASAPNNRDLWYLRGMANRGEGLSAQAAKDLQRCLEVDPRYAAAWNTLGLVRISLKEFDRAEEALERARTLALDDARQANAPPGEEYTSILFNLATFHDGLASHYGRENRIEPTVEARRLLQRHSSEARKYFGEFLQREPAGSPDAQTARTRMSQLAE